MMRLMDHIHASRAIWFARNELALVGLAGDRDRRRHQILFPGLAVKIEERGMDWTPRPFLTPSLVREIMMNGCYAEQRIKFPELRLPDEVIGVCSMDEPLHGLSYREAEVLAGLVGGRLPTEKELDYITALLDGKLDEDESWLAWTSSRWSPFSYSLALYEPVRGLWIEPPKSRLAQYLPDSVNQSVLQIGQDITRPPRSRNDTADIRCFVVFDVEVSRDEALR